MEWMRIEQAEPVGEDKIARYKKDCPPDTALIVSDGTHCAVLDYIGLGLEYWEETCCVEGLEEAFKGEPPGVWIWEGAVKEDKFWTDYGWEYDAELEGKTRPLTEDEWTALVDREPLWDISRWFGDDDEDTQDQVRPGDQQ